MNRSEKIARSHPFLAVSLNSEVEVGDTLDNCAAALFLLADLFGGNADSYAILASDNTRRGMFAQLFSLAITLEDVSAALEKGGANDDEAEHEITIPVTDAEFVQLATLGRQCGLTADQMLERLLKDRLARETDTDKVRRT